EPRLAFLIDPCLLLSTAALNVSGMTGAFGDCAPDRWGRYLVSKQHRRLVAAGDVRDRRLTEVDYLLGVSDMTRPGALRFRRSTSGDYLATGTRIPKT